MDNYDTIDLYQVLYFAKPFKICGIEMYPLSLGHCIALEVLNIQSLKLRPNKDAKITITDMVQFLMICSAKYADYLQLYNSNQEKEQLFSKTFQMVVMYGPEKTLDEIIEYRKYYLSYYPTIKSVAKDVQSTDEIVVPVETKLQYNLINHWHMHWNDTFDIPFNAAMSLSIAHGSIEGLIDINPTCSKEMEEIWQKVDALAKDPELFKKEFKDLIK